MPRSVPTPTSLMSSFRAPGLRATRRVSSRPQSRVVNRVATLLTRSATRLHFSRLLAVLRLHEWMFLATFVACGSFHARPCTRLPTLPSPDPSDRAIPSCRSGRPRAPSASLPEDSAHVIRLPSLAVGQQTVLVECDAQLNWPDAGISVTQVRQCVDACVV